MNVLIEIHFRGDTRLRQSGSFLLHGKKVKQVALNFWKEIQKGMSYRAVLEKVIVNGEYDITDLVRELEKDEWIKKNETVDDLPF